MPRYMPQSLPQYYERDVVAERPRPSGMKNGERRSISRRAFRALVRFSTAVLIGVGVTLTWQSHGDEATEMVRTWAPSLEWLLPVSTTKSSPDDQVSAAAAAVSQQLEPMALSLAIVRRSVEQLAAMVEQLGANQEQLAKNIAKLQEVEQDISQKISTPSQSKPVPPRKPPQPVAQSSSGQSPSESPPPPPAGQPLRLLDGAAQSAR